MKKLIIILFLFAFSLNAQIQLAEDWTLNPNNVKYDIVGGVIGGGFYLGIGNNPDWGEKDIETFKYKYRGAVIATSLTAIVIGGANFMGGGEVSLSGTGYMIASGIATAWVLKRISIRRYKKRQKKFDIKF